MSSLIELSTSATITREQAATHLRTIADHRERHNDVEFARGGTELEIEISW